MNLVKFKVDETNIVKNRDDEEAWNWRQMKARC